jgi:maleylacetoacetate isomerase
MHLHTYHQSSASYRVRIALNLKGIAVSQSFHDLTKAQQHNADYARINPQKMVPSLVLDSGDVLTQSLAIIEYLDENFSGAPLLPKEPIARAHARAISMLIAGDISPINNLKIRLYLKSDLGANDAAVTRWIGHWISDGFTALEALLARSPHTGNFCVGNVPSMADCCLVPQIFNARRFGVDLTDFSNICRIVSNCEAHPAFIAAHPSSQPDAPKN